MHGVFVLLSIFRLFDQYYLIIIFPSCIKENGYKGSKKIFSYHDEAFFSAILLLYSMQERVVNRCGKGFVLIMKHTRLYVFQGKRKFSVTNIISSLSPTVDKKLTTRLWDPLYLPIYSNIAKKYWWVNRNYWTVGKLYGGTSHYIYFD